MEKLFDHQREGFIWQKLREPRSYDYKKTQNKGYNERLRMPQFTVASTTTSAKRSSRSCWAWWPSRRRRSTSIAATPRATRSSQGSQVIDKFNCTGCHALSWTRWELAYEPGDFAATRRRSPIIAFLKPHFTPRRDRGLAGKTDAAGLRNATLVGMPAIDENGKPLRVDDDGAPIEAGRQGNARRSSRSCRGTTC